MTDAQPGLAPGVRSPPRAGPGADRARTSACCERVCDGKAFWNTATQIPRKCTQSAVDICALLAAGGEGEGEDSTAPAFVRKRFVQQQPFEKEKAMLKLLERRCKERGCNCQGRFPQVMSHSSGERELVLSHCGVPVTPSTVPRDCEAQVRALGAALECVGLQHRDLLPHNVLMKTAPGAGTGADAAGVLTLIDFGRARSIKRGDVGREQRGQQRQQLEQLVHRLCDPSRLARYLKRDMREQRRAAAKRGR